ncbi:hypothetical protein CEXT_424071 [Caerostris extrusa]|uniref:Uncharacterized protein n=1 Tax=Caerostris extrusa TaxID=172846 RepID=A0AAV4M6U8_CAEEX|nr:hypothetical protein CEXT_424071 [Caerostris extrusa]
MAIINYDRTPKSVRVEYSVSHAGPASKPFYVVLNKSGIDLPPKRDLPIISHGVYLRFDNYLLQIFQFLNDILFQQYFDKKWQMVYRQEMFAALSINN